MDNEFDYRNMPDPEQQPTDPQQEETASAQQSPYYGSPYDYTPYTPQPEPQPQPQPEPAPQVHSVPPKKRSGKGLVIAVSIVAAVMLLFNLVALASNADLKKSLNDAQDRNDALSDQIDALQQQIDGLGTQGGTVTTPGTPSQSVSTSDLMTPQQVYSMNVDAVVAISSQAVQTNIYGQVSKTASSGSGFIISADGYVVTNFHVIEGASQIVVITSDETEHAATVVGYDETNDVALLKIQGEDFHHVTLGSSDALQVGDQVMAIGNPLGELTSTLTVGYVSGKDRMVTTDGTGMNMIQTDAAINSGNSGGPLFNAKGEVIGINTAKYSGTSSSGATIEGIGFAIPIDDVVSIINDLQDKGYVSSTYLGVMVREVDSSAQSFGLPAGAYVEEVTAGYCAEAAGIQVKDIIVAIGDYEVNSLNALSRALRRFKPGDQTTITVYRSGREVTLDIVLDEKPVEAAVEVPEEETQQQEQQKDYSDIWDYFFPNG